MASQEKKITIPTLITLSRIAMVPFIVFFILHHQWTAAFFLFAAAAATDALDGTLARLLGEQTFLGACLDPIADKILLLSCFFALSSVQSSFMTVPGWFFWIIFIKEIALVVGAVVVYWVRGELEVKPTMLGKATAAAQMLFIVWFFACSFFHWLPFKTFYILLILMVVLALASLVHYAVIGLRFFFRFLS